MADRQEARIVLKSPTPPDRQVAPTGSYRLLKAPPWESMNLLRCLPPVTPGPVWTLSSHSPPGSLPLLPAGLDGLGVVCCVQLA